MKKEILLLLVWICLAGYVNAQNPQWINYTNGDNIQALAEEGNYMWVGTTGGLVQIDKTTGNTTFYNKANSGLPSNNVNSIAIEDDGTKWIGTGYYSNEGGLVSFDGNNWTVYNTTNSGLPDNWILSIAIGNDGTKWIGTECGGLASFDGVNWTVYDTSNSGLPDNYVSSIAIEDSDIKWIGTGSGGLTAYNEDGILVRIHENVKTEHLLQIYPNLAEDYVNIELLSKANISFIEIINMQCKIVKQKKVETNQGTLLDVRDLPNGFYIIRIYTENGITTQKLIKN